MRRLGIGIVVGALFLGTATLAHAVSTTVSFSAPVLTVDIFSTNLRNSVTGDFNSDGIPDVVSASSGGTSKLDLFLGERSGQFGLPTSTNLTGSTQVAGIAVGDVNNDGFLDVAVTSYVPSDEIFIALGNGRGAFTVLAPMALIVKPWAIALADMNNDGRLDIVFSTEENPAADRKVGVAIGAGNGTFSTPSLTTIANVATAQVIAVGYVNADANLDVVTSNGLSASASILLGDGSGGLTFSSTQRFTTFDPNITSASGIGIGDFDSDGLGELVVSVGANFSAEGLLLIDPHVAPTSILRYPVDATAGLLTVGDVTLDGIPDVVTAWPGSDQLVIWPGLGDGTLSTPPYAEVMGVSPGRFRSGAYLPMLVDYDGNGALDVIVTGEDYAIATVFNLLIPAVSPLPRFTFTYRPPDGLECGSISPQTVISQTWVPLPPADAACTIGNAHIIGWRIPGQDWAFSPNQKVRVVDSQQFTAQISAIKVIYDANVGASDACVANGQSVDIPERQMSTYVERAALVSATQPSALQAPCTPPGHELVGWTLREEGVSLRIGEALPPVAGTPDAVTLYAQWRPNESGRAINRS